MKAERRHELKGNDLAHALEVARDYLDTNGKQIGIAVIVVLGVIAVVAFTVRSQAAAREYRWRRIGELSFADLEVGRRSLEALATMTQDVSDERFVFTSLVQQGQQASRLAQDVPVPPDRELNEKAGEAFEQLLERFKDNPLALGIAHSGLATVAENAFALDGDPAHKEQADAHLAAIIDNPALNGMPFQRMALDRRKALDETFTRVDFKYPVPPEGPVSPMTSDEPLEVEYAEEVDQVDPEAPPEEPVSPIEPADSENTEPEDAGTSASEPIDIP